MSTIIIGLSGLAGSGKDTVADWMVRERGFRKMALADPLKRLAQQVYGFTAVQLWGPSAERNRPDPRYPREHIFPWLANSNSRCSVCGVQHWSWQRHPTENACYLTPRYALQQLGSEWGRHCYQNTWIELLLREIEALPPWEDGTKRIVIPDCRFINEFEVLRKSGAQLARVRRPSVGAPSFTHDSENEQLTWDDSRFDAVIQNDGELSDLPAKLDGMLERFL
jgi:hypothetical protein